MTFTILNALVAHTRSSQATRAVVAAMLLLASFGPLQSALAQNMQPRAVARLITEPMADARNSRPQRVSLEALAAASKSVTSGSPAFDEANAIERRAFEQTNVARTKNGLPMLVWDPQLCRMAREHSKQMASLGYFSHGTPDGLKLKERAHASGILHFRVIGENIAYNKGYDDPGGFAVERWLMSAGHRANMLNPGFQASAIGSYVAADGSAYLTQVFIAR